MKKYKVQNLLVIFIIGFSIVILGLTVFLTMKNTKELQCIIEDSVKSQLISTSIAARELIDAEKFVSYNSAGDINDDIDAYLKILENLRILQKQTGTKYIYALKFIDGKYYFVFDTDDEIKEAFLEYEEISEVHKEAFTGKNAAGVMNVVDEWGSFNTGAIPITDKDGSIIGIISADIEDAYIQKSNSTSMFNAMLLLIALFTTLCSMIIVVLLLLRNVRKTQDKLFMMSNYDVLTGLPNRRYLMEYLPKIAETAVKKQTSFAMFLIDLDNFKKVNDNAGHDAGDELLRHISKYLDGIHNNSKSFRPSAGMLNVSARIGGDEFVQIVPGIGTKEEAAAVAQKVLDNFSNSAIDRFVEQFKVGLSIGVAIFPHNTQDFNVLIKYADIAMYHAKKHGKNSFCIYNEELSKNETDEQRENAANDRRKNRG